MDDIKNQMMGFANQIQSYLGDVNAHVEKFNFAVGKSDKGITIDCQVKADIGGISMPGTSASSS